MLAAKGLSILIKHAKGRSDIKGAWVAEDLTITHLWFMDDVLLFCDIYRRDISTIKEVFFLFQKAKWMLFNFQK